MTARMKSVVSFTITKLLEDILMLILDEIWERELTFKIQSRCSSQAESIGWKWRITEEMEKFNSVIFMF